MLGLWLFLAVVLCLVFGWVGVAIASNKGVSSAAGFWLGFFLGPIGLVIVALLSPSAEGQTSTPLIPQQFDGQRDLNSDSYKLWLTSRYDIKKNEVLGSYVCQEHLFPTVDSALAYATEQHQAELAAADAEARAKEELRAKRREEDLKRQQEADEAFRRWKPYLVFFGALAAIGFCYLIYWSALQQAEQTRIEQQKAAEAKRKHDALLAPINATLASYGAALIGDNAIEPGPDKDEDLCTFGIKKIVGKSLHFITATYPPDKTVGDLKLSPSGDWTREAVDQWRGIDQQWLFSNKRTGNFALIVAHDETDYQASASDLTFRTRVHLCVGKPVNLSTDMDATDMNATDVDATDVNATTDLPTTTSTTPTDDEFETTTDTDAADMNDTVE